MLKSCTDFNKMNTEQIAQIMEGYKLEANSAINSVIGSDLLVRGKFEGKGEEGRLIYNTYNKVRQLFMDVLVKNGENFHFLNDPAESTEGLKEYIFRTHFVHTEFLSKIANVNPKQYLSVLRRLDEVLSRWRSNKEWNPWLKAFMPIVLFSTSHDRLGHMNRVVKHAVDVTEVVKSHTADKLTSISETEAAFGNTVQQIIEYPSRSDVLDGLFDVPTQNTVWPVVTYKGHVTKDGNPMHFVSVFDKGVSKDMLLPERDINKSVIREALVHKYLHELSNDLGSGQARKQVFKDDIEPEHFEFVKDILDYASENDIPISSMRGVNITDLGDRAYYTLAIKSKPDAAFLNEEDFSVYLIGHKEIGAENSFVGYRKEKAQKPDFDELRNQGALIGSKQFLDGYFKADNYSSVNIISERSKTGKKQDFTNFTYMENQPNTRIVVDTVSTAESNISYMNLWGVVKNKRAIYRKVMEDAVEFIEVQQREYKNMFQVSPKIKKSEFQKNLEGIYGEQTVSLNTTMRLMFNMASNLYYDKETGMLSTPNSNINGAMKEGYWPQLFHDRIVINELERAKEEILERISSVNMDMETKDESLAQVAQFEETHRGITERNRFFKKEEIPMAIAERNVFLKAREDWIDGRRRRKDSLLDHDYLDSMYYRLEKDKLVTNLITSINSIAIGFKDDPVMAKAQIDLAINVVKKSISDNTAKAEIAGFDLSYNKMAKNLNKYMRTDIGADGAKNISDTAKALITTVLLGADGALINRTQSVNPGIDFGFKYTAQAFAIMEGDNKSEKLKWKAIVDATGVTNIVTGFTDSMMPGGDIGFSDLGFIDPKIAFGFQIPTSSIWDWTKLLLRNKEKASSIRPAKEVEEFFERLEDIRIESYGSSLAQAQQKLDKIEKDLKKELSSSNRRKLSGLSNTVKRELNKIKNLSQRQDAVDLRKNYMQLLLTEKDTKESVVERRYMNILGKVQKNRLQRMVSAKLSWWPSWLKGKGYFTFSEGELEMRESSAIAHLLYLDDLGLLKSTGTETVNVLDDNRVSHSIIIDNKFKTPFAKRSARSVVSMTLYGMTAVNLGSAMYGLGDLWGQYKAYTLQQMIHDYQIYKTFVLGNTNKGKHMTPVESTARIAKAMVQIAKYKSGKAKYNPKDDRLDHDAIRVVRFLYTRFMASIIASFFEIVRPSFLMSRVSGFSAMLDLSRGSQNPLLAVFFRVVINTFLLLGFYGDDDDKLVDQGVNIGRTVSMLLLPPWITLVVGVLVDLAIASTED